MKIQSNVTVFKCDFCNKKLFRKHAMENHELKCNLNPLNDRPCLHCPNLEMRDIEYDSGVNDYHSGENIYRKAQAFYCSKKEIFVLHPKVNFRENGNGLRNIYFNDNETEQFDMPKECEIYKNQTHDISSIFG